MTKIFVGGSRKISHLNADVRERLDRIVSNQFLVLVGDANGADKATQGYLKTKSYSSVEVFCAGKICRNNVGHWPTKMISAEKLRGFDFYAAKDRIMADEASYGLMIWDGDSIGTLMNIVRLIGKKKPVAVFVSPAKKFVDLRDAGEFHFFLLDYAPQLQSKLEARAASELSLVRSQSQMSML